ncbi:26S proteasome non-ATPase regulatory subunit 10-like, partial [Lethenteron reissneri]|uniref:26S proteasome non-ATPase regulatory subunit 10-like n=1 Tax=Lethenteron reissneri TaxID=7753 RepID=UPI002AB7B8EF
TCSDGLRSTPLHRAAAQGHSCCVQLLLQHGASSNLQDAQGNTPLHLACEEERTDVAQLLLVHGASVDIANREGLTPLQLAPRGLATLLRRALCPPTQS